MSTDWDQYSMKNTKFWFQTILVVPKMNQVFISTILIFFLFFSSNSFLLFRMDEKDISLQFPDFLISFFSSVFIAEIRFFEKFSLKKLRFVFHTRWRQRWWLLIELSKWFPFCSNECTNLIISIAISFLTCLQPRKSE